MVFASKDKIQAFHAEMIRKFLEDPDGYAAFAAEHLPSTDINIGKTIRPFVLGGAAYSWHMWKNSSIVPKKDLVHTDDIDFKFFFKLEDTHNADFYEAEGNFYNCKLYRLDLLHFLDEWVRMYLSSTHVPKNIKVKEMRLYNGRMKFENGENYLNITSSDSFDKFLRRLRVQDNLYSLLISVSLVYHSNEGDEGVEKTLWDLTIAMDNPSYSIVQGEPEYNISNDSFEVWHKYKKYITNEWKCKNNFVDCYVDTVEATPHSTNAKIASLEYVILDTARMICKVQKLKPNISSYCEVYKYLKYVRKFFHLCLVRDQNDPVQKSKIQNLFKTVQLQSMPNPSVEDDDEWTRQFNKALLDMHNKILEFDASNEGPNILAMYVPLFSGGASSKKRIHSPKMVNLEDRLLVNRLGNRPNDNWRQALTNEYNAFVGGGKKISKRRL